MPTYGINPYISFVESRLIPGVVQHAVFHRLTGEIIEPNEQVLNLLLATTSGTRLSINEAGPQLTQLIEKEFLIPVGHDPLALMVDQYVTRPIQNPAVMYRSKGGEWILVRTSMMHTVYSRRRDELPEIIEEKLSPLTADILLRADGTKTLRQIREESTAEDSEFRSAIDFLTVQERQLIKFTTQLQDLDEPYSLVNILPRNLYHSARKDDAAITDFHLHGIEDASWEFDLIEPTVNHCFRFPHEALGGFDYGSRFCIATLSLMNNSPALEVLEVGGGTGTFARAFLNQAASLKRINYHILDLSPALMASQRKILAELLPESRHFHQDATEFDLRGQTFDLIVSNEVIADFPVASVNGEGAHYVDKYNLSNKNAPASAVVNVGAFRFIERAWKHLNSGGTLIVSEYGAEDLFPTQCYHLNHEEYSIHFGHLAACAEQVGFQCRLLTLKDFLGMNDEVPVLNGREEHLLCLNHVFKNYGHALPYAVISKADFEAQCQRIVEETGLIGYSFSPLNKGYHFGPPVRDFLVLICHKEAQ